MRRIQKVQATEIESAAQGFHAGQLVPGKHRQMRTELVEMFDDLHLGVVADVQRRAHARDLRQQGGRFIDRINADVQNVLQRVQNRVVNAEHDRERDQGHQATAGRVDPLLLHQLLHFLLHFQPVVCIFGADLLLLGSHLAVGRHGFLLLDRKRKEQKLGDDCKQNNRNTIVRDNFIKEPQQISQNTAKPIENFHVCLSPLF